MSASFDFKNIVAAVILCGVTTAAFAQFVWLDEKGVKQYSDMPPPPSIPKKNILKAPGSPSQSAPVVVSDTKPASAAGEAASGPMTTAEKNAAFNKRKMAEAEKEKKLADQAKLESDKAKNCERTRNYKRALDSGERIGSTNSNGDRTLISDEQRARDTKDAKAILDDCK